MPRPKKPPRLTLRRDSDGRRRWIVKDGERYHRTGCLESETEKAEARLADYIAEKYRPNTGAGRASNASIADILMVYMDAKADSVARRSELEGQIARLNEFWGGMTANEIRGETCRRFTSERGKPQAARRDLETLRAAVNHYAREYGLDGAPRFTMPDKALGRERWLTRSEAAALLWACMGWEKKGRAWRRRKGSKRNHLARFILIGLYTGTRHEAILRLRWMRNTAGGWIDLEEGVLHRRGLGQRETRKHRTPVRMAPRLLAHARRWQRIDGKLPNVIRYHGKPVTRIEKAFRGVRSAAGLNSAVVPHTLRHTRATWLMRAGVDLWDAANSLGMTMKQLEDTYGHHHPDFQRASAEAY